MSDRPAGLVKASAQNVDLSYMNSQKPTQTDYRVSSARKVALLSEALGLTVCTMKLQCLQCSQHANLYSRALQTQVQLKGLNI